MKLSERIRRFRRRRSMRKRRSRGMRRSSRFRGMSLGPIVKIGGLAVLGIGLIVLIILLVIPLFGGTEEDNDAAIAPATPTPTPPPIARADMSDLASELEILHKSINDPYMFANEVAFSTGNQLQASPTLESIAVFDTQTKQTTVVEGITKKYSFLFEPKLTDNYIVYLDCKDKYGGAVCGYNRETGESFVMREYLYGKPKVSVAGEYAFWSQQTGRAVDRLYLYHLPTQETAEIEVLFDTPFAVSAPYMSKDALVFVQPFGESDVLDGSSPSEEAEICVIPLRQGGDANRILFRPGIYVYDPMISGNNIIFLDSNRDHQSQLMLCRREGDAYTQPVAIAKGVLNYCIGDGFVAYTKDDAIYIYYFADGSSGRLSSDSTRAFLASTNGKDVLWYDITDLGAANVVFHARVP